MAESIGPIRAILVSNENLQKEIEALEAQIEGLSPGSPEYLYDQLNLEKELREQEVRKEHPDLDPLNPEDNEKLNQLLAQDPTYQRISHQLDEIRREFASEVSSWGIPWYPSDAVPVQ